MGISQQDIKLLWGRAASRCSVCRRELTQEKAAAAGVFVLGEQAHIVAEQSGGPRGASILTAEERNSYPNLILLCPTHHAVIDKDVHSHPVEKLHHIKMRHEIWVQQTLADSSGTPKLSGDLVCTYIVDLAVDHCKLEMWERWTNNALFSHPCWDLGFPEQIEQFRHEVLKAVWPDVPDVDELKRSTSTLAYVLHEAAQLFLDHAEEADGRLNAVRFYKDQWYTQTEYHRRADLYEQWDRSCKMLVLEATKAANWFADCVRARINPAFFTERGKFLVTSSFINSGESVLLEYSTEEKVALPESFLKARKRKRQAEERRQRTWIDRLIERTEAE